MCVKVSVESLNGLLTSQFCILHLVLLSVIAPAKCILKHGPHATDQPSNNVRLLGLGLRLGGSLRFLISCISHVFISVPHGRSLKVRGTVAQHSSFSPSRAQAPTSPATLRSLQRLLQATRQTKQANALILDHLVLIMVPGGSSARPCILFVVELIEDDMVRLK